MAKTNAVLNKIDTVRGLAVFIDSIPYRKRFELM
jgi:hypothetical protein